MVLLIEDLCIIKKYKLETLFLAVSIADRFLASQAIQGKIAPCLISLALTSLLLAAKLEQPVAPSFTRLIRVFAEKYNTLLKK